MNALRVFDAAARYSSFSRAAEELCITQGAVSRHISMLEAHLGTKLFIRIHRGVELTNDAKRYHKRLRRAFDEIRSATDEINAASGREKLKLKCLPTFAMRWLVPRLAGFSLQYPNLEIQVTTSQVSPTNFEIQGVDASIEYGTGGWPGLIADPLFDESIIPVCSSRFTDKLPVPCRPEDLCRYPLLHSLQRPDFWRQWLKAAGVSQAPADAGLHFENSGLACQAAIAGLGIAIMHLPLVEKDLESGRLIAPFKFVVRNEMSFFLAYPANKAKNQALLAFRSWLLQEAASTVKSIDLKYSKSPLIDTPAEMTVDR